MKVYRKGTGEKYTPFNHFDMTTQVIFNPDTGCPKVNATLTTLKKGAGSQDEIHENSDQLFYMIQGTMNVYAHGSLIETLNAGDALAGVRRRHPRREKRGGPGCHLFCDNGAPAR